MVPIGIEDSSPPFESAAQVGIDSMLYSDMFDNPEDSDATVVLSTGRRVPVHKIILKHYSPALRAALTAPMKEAAAATLSFPEHTDWAVLTLLHHAYGEPLDLHSMQPKDWLDLLAFAHYLNDTTLLTRMIDFTAPMEANPADLVLAGISLDLPKLVTSGIFRYIRLQTSTFSPKQYSRRREGLCALPMEAYWKMRSIWIGTAFDVSLLLELDCYFCDALGAEAIATFTSMFETIDISKMTHPALLAAAKYPIISECPLLVRALTCLSMVAKRTVITYTPPDDD